MDDSNDLRDTTDSSDDLNITQSVRRGIGHEDYIKSAPVLPQPFLELRTDTPCS